MSEFNMTSTTYRGSRIFDWIGPDNIEYEIDFTAIIHGPGDDDLTDDIDAEQPNDMSDDMWDDSWETIEALIEIYAGAQTARQLREQ
jgi:hypothetical protein